MLSPDNSTIFFSIWDWIFAYLFVISSSVVFLFALYLGLCGRRIFVSKTIVTKIVKKKLSLWMVVSIFLLFAVWTYLMVQLKIGMTIYADFDPLPYRLTGVLFYGRLFIQPFIILYIANNYRETRNRWLIFLLLLSLGTYVSLASGSRFIAIMFSLPLLMLFSGKSRVFFFLIIVALFISIATLSRNFYLPNLIGGEYLEIYGNELYKATVIENVWMIAISYLLTRTMGIS
jgi:hypothetical protein